VGRIEKSYDMAAKAARAAFRGKAPMPNNPVIALTSEGFVFGEDDLPRSVAVTEILGNDEMCDGAVAEAEAVLGWLAREYTNHQDKNLDDWQDAIEQVQKGGSFAPLLPWAKKVKKRKVAEPDPQAEFLKTWRCMAAQREKVMEWRNIPAAKRARYKAAGVTSWAAMGGRMGGSQNLARAAWDVWMGMPEPPKRT
jgi:hypothetical protein